MKFNPCFIARLATLSLLLIAGLTTGAAGAERSKPNIVFILADDLGWTDVACYGSKYYETPNIDRLATQGMKLTRYHNCQNCQPTRAAIMSGQYGPRTGVYTVGGIDRFDWKSRPLRPVDNVEELPLDCVTIAQSLKKAGYATGMFGKWHLGQKGAYHPSQRGFDEAITSMGVHFNFETQPPVEHPKDAYLADWLTDKSVDFIRRHKDGPFFLYLPHFAVHAPLEAKKELIEKFKLKPPVGGHNNPVYAGMIYSVDESVGRVMALLDELKLADNTVLIFSSDNGGVGGYAREGIKNSDTTDNAPLRSGKGSLYEGGTRDPFIVRWPGKVKPGSTCDVPSIHVDLYPTLLEIAGGTPPAKPGSRRRKPCTALSRRGREPEARGDLSAFPRISRRRRRYLAHHAGCDYRSRGLEADGVFRGRPARTLQPPRRHRRKEQPRRAHAGQGKGTARKDAGMARGDQSAHAGGEQG